MRRRARAVVAFSGLLALAIPLAAIAASRDTSAPPSFAKDVAPIVQQKCAGCHQLGGIAPFPFETAKQISSRSSLIAGAVQTGVMPPWPPGPKSPAYVGESQRRLTARERATILDWARAGGRVDGPARKPLAPETARALPGETILDMRPPAAYTPSAPKGVTDDYRCFLLDPKVSGDMSVTSARIEPGARKVVHHVILFRVASSQVAEAKRLDSGARGQGWSCFGDTGLSLGSGAGIQDSLNDANWVAAWAPGWGGNRVPEGTGVPLPAGSRIIMQVHYNLLNGRTPDRSRAVLTAAPASKGLKPLRTMLMPGPVELACASGEEQGRLCSRNEALFELSRKYGPEAGFVPAGLLLLCRGNASTPKPSAVSTCDRRISQPTTIHVAAGHMHLLGASVRLELNPGTSSSRVLLDIPRWDFHWQNSYQLAKPVRAKPGDVVRVTCRHDVHKRMHGGHGIPKTPRYVLWGEGTTDEMCLGILQVTRG